MNERHFYLTCEKCIHYASHDTTPRTGTCRRNAPSPVTAVQAGSRKPGWLDAYWPTVSGSDWCGEFKAQIYVDTPGSYS